MKHATSLLLIVCTVLAPSFESAAKVPTPSDPRVLRVATGQARPFVIEEDGKLTGFSIDLMNALAQRLDVKLALTNLGAQSQAEQLKSLQRGEADVAMSAIAMTAERERLVDFSMPYYDSGLQIMVPVQKA